MNTEQLRGCEESELKKNLRGKKQKHEGTVRYEGGECRYMLWKSTT